MRIRLNISTCPNDTFIFYGLLHGKVDSYGYSFDADLMDIDELNHSVMQGEGDISKISCAVYPQIAERYAMLSSGGAIGYGNGPVLVSRHKIYPDEIGDVRVAIPGEQTTAALLLERTLGSPKEQKPYLFSDIAEVVMSGEADAGVLIHEGRFTYQDMGLRLIADLGEQWDRLFSLPVPLGSIVARREFSSEQLSQFGAMISSSVEYGFAHRQECYPFIQSYAKEMDVEVIDKHIDTFVNNFSIDMGSSGREAIEKLLNIEL